MGKRYEVQQVRAWQPQEFVTDGGSVVGFVVGVELNLGGQSITQSLDIWPFLSAGQKTAINSFYQVVADGLNRYYVTEEITL